jgi:NADH:ubiquinone oxidoreductase subunit F (NADH-binding)
MRPESLDDYIADGGYTALRTAVTELAPATVRALIAKAGLRGRGGAGFDTAKKWSIAAETPSDERYVVANAFGADDASFGDRTLMENDPHAVLEGLAIAAYAIGARRAFVYCCADHTAAVQSIGRAIRQAEEGGFLGSVVLGTGFDCHVTVVTAPAGFAAGEETAAIAVIAGERPMPRERPPYPAAAGLHGKPTVVNNSETLANVPWIVQHGAEAFVWLGSAGNAGTKLLTVLGCVNGPGVVEVPFGTTLGEVIANYAGGVRPGHAIKAVQLGGPAGGCLPGSAIDTKLEFETIAAVGGIVGSGALLVLDESVCMVDFARARVEMLAAESCGRCVPGRLGTHRLAAIMQQIATGEGRPGDLDLLVELSQNMADGAACGYGIAAVNPILTTILHFRSEYETHIQDKRCPTGCCEMSAAKTPERREELWKRKWPIRR